MRANISDKLKQKSLHDFSYATIEEAATLLEGVANKTPVVTSRTLNTLINADISIKCENFQRIGAFKFRGAFYTLSKLTEAQKRSGVIAYSSGNHAQAIALAGQILDIPRLIVMPEDAPQVKLDATRNYGAEVVLYDKTKITREELAHQIAVERNLTIVPPYDHPHIIAGQGTAAKEFFDEIGPLDYLLVCCGGGGLLSGSAVACRTLSPDCKVIGVEPAKADDATRTFYSGTLQYVSNPETIADGARTPSLGKYTYPIVMEYVSEMMTVTEREIIEGMRFLWERMKLVVEPTGALATAALLSKAHRFKGARVGVIISGGNVDLASLATFFSLKTRTDPPRFS